MTSLGSEHFALSLIAMVADKAEDLGLYPFIDKHGRPNWDSLDVFTSYAGSGERAIVEQARSAWSGQGFTGICGALNRLDTDNRREVLTRLIEAYGDWLPASPYPTPTHTPEGTEYRSILVTKIRGES